MGKSLADEEYVERCQNKNAEKYKQEVRERSNWHAKNLEQLRLNFIKIVKQFVYQRVFLRYPVSVKPSRALYWSEKI